MVHMVSGMLYTIGWKEAPQSASALGRIFRWKDGRTMQNTHAVRLTIMAFRFMYG